MIELGIGRGPDQAERRSYESLLIDALETQSLTLASLRGLTIGAVEAAAGAYGRAFASAAVTPQTGASLAVGPAVLASIARRLIRHGESYHLIDVYPSGRLRLVEASSVTATGGPDPATWRYQITTAGPSRTTTRTVEAAAVVHCRYSTAPERPWAGRGPLQWAVESGS